MVCAMHVGKNEKKIDSSAGCSPGDTRPVPIYYYCIHTSILYVYINTVRMHIYIHESHGKSLRRSQTHTHTYIILLQYVLILVGC